MAEVNDTGLRIKEKAHTLFMQYGLRSVSMDDIATSLGISKKTIYHFYADKDALVDDVIATELLNDECICERDKQAAENAIHEIFLAIDFIVEMFKGMNPTVFFDMQKYYPKSYVRFAKHKDEFLYNVVRKNLVAGVEEGLYRPELKIDILARFRVEAIMLPFNPNFYGKLKENLGVIEEEITLHFLHGLLTPKGYKLAQKYQAKRIKSKTNETIKN